MSRYPRLAALLIALLFPLAAGRQAAHAQSAPPSGSKANPPAGAVAADPYNDRMAVQVGPDGRFNIGAFPDPSTGGATSASWDLMYRWPSSPWSSFSTLRIDGADSVYGSSAGRWVQAPQETDSVTNQSTWQTGDVSVTQTLQIVPNIQTGQQDTAKIAYTLHNTGTTSHDVGLRVMIDTELNYNDGAPYRVPGTGIVTKETDLTGTSIPDSFQAFFNLTDNQHVAVSTLRGGDATPPDRLVLAGWPHLDNTSYDYTVDPNYDFTTVGYPDSAYAVYWNPISLAPGQSTTYVTYYGLAQLDVNLQPPLALGVSGPATLSIVGGQYSPNPFDVVATVWNNGTATATNVQLALDLPTGLSLASGAAIQSLGDLPVGQERQVSWSVRADPQTSQTTLTYGVTASASNTPDKTVQRNITLPALTKQRQIFFVHGIKEDANAVLNQDGWGPLLQPLVAKYSENDVIIWPYFQDRAYAVPGTDPPTCGSDAPAPDPRGQGVIPVDTSQQSVGINQCDSESDLGLNAGRLDQFLQAISGPTKQTAIVAYSMGASITRGWLAYAQRAHPSNLYGVDTAIFMLGVQQGSWLAGGYGGILRLTNVPVIGPLVKSIFSWIIQHFGFYTGRPAMSELAPRSSWYGDINTQDVPSSLHYFNFYSDIQLKPYVLIGWRQLGLRRTLGSIPFGDLVILPGTDSPTDTPLEGGAKFLPGGTAAPDRYEWSMPSGHDVDVTPVLEGRFPPDLPVELAAMLMDPRTHTNFSHNVDNGQIQVSDCKTGSQVTPLQQILAILADPANACQG